MEAPSLTSSGSVQSHMSSSISKKRLRTHYHFPHPEGPPLPVTTPRPAKRFPAWSSLSNVYVRSLVAVYLCFSIAFLSSSLYALIRDVRHPHSSSPQDDWYISPTQRLSRILSHYPTPTDFRPFLLRAVPHANLHAPTACFSCTDNVDIGLLTRWAQRWQGPISIAMTLSDSSDDHQLQLLHRLEPLKLFPHVSIHTLGVSGNISFNALLNLARLFAITPTVVLFPDMSLPLQSSQSLSEYIKHRKHLPALLTNASTTKDMHFPLPALSPLILPQEYPVWCPERFFFTSSRAFDWEECLWRMWVEDQGHFGRVNLNTTFSIQDDSVALPSFMTKTRDRLALRYRSETCDLLVKSQNILGTATRRQVHWLKNFCMQTAEVPSK